MSDAADLLVIDASVVVKWFLAQGESEVESAATLLADHAAGRCALVAPALLAHEVLGVLARRLPADAREDAVEALYDVGIHLMTPTRDLSLAAARLIAERQVSAFDSAYAALASALGCPLATADRRLANALGDSVQMRLV
jgi:predicted nucleic acid-binding protein